jgi:hypothetical protein
MSLIALILAVVAYGPDDRWNQNLDHVNKNNRIDEFFNHAVFYITMDYEEFKVKKAEYEVSHTHEIIEGYIKTLTPKLKKNHFGTIFGAFSKLKGELYVNKDQLLELERKEITFQITTICLLSTLFGLSTLQLILCFYFSGSKTKKAFKPLVRRNKQRSPSSLPTLALLILSVPFSARSSQNIAFHAVAGCVMLTAGILYMLSSFKITENHEEVAKLVRGIAIKMYKNDGLVFPYKSPSPGPEVKEDHFIHSCGYWGFRENGANALRGAIPLRNCHKGKVKFASMVSAAQYS